MNTFVSEALNCQAHLKECANEYQVAIAAEADARRRKDEAKEALADAETMELAARDLEGYTDNAGKAMAVSSKAYATAREAHLVQARAGELFGLARAADEATSAHLDAVMGLQAAQAAFSAAKAACTLQGEVLRFMGGAGQATLVAQVENIASIVARDRRKFSDEIDRLSDDVVNNSTRIDHYAARGKQATEALGAAGKALASFATTPAGLRHEFPVITDAPDGEYNVEDGIV